MKAVYIYPEDIGTNQWSEKWAIFVGKFGYDLPIQQLPQCILVTEIIISSE